MNPDIGSPGWRWDRPAVSLGPWKPQSMAAAWAPADAPEYALEAEFFHALYRGGVAAARKSQQRPQHSALAARINMRSIA
jgi:hypothetical protein